MTDALLPSHATPADADCATSQAVDDWQPLHTRLLTRLRDAVDARQAAEAALKEQYGHLAVTAHELRSPLAPMFSALAVLKSLQSSEPRVGQVHALMERQLALLSTLVDDLLDVSRLTTGKLSMKRRTVALMPMIDTALQCAQPALRRRGQSVTLVLPEQPLYLQADPVRLLQVFGNLLDNASKYTPDGGTLTVEVTADGHRMALSVKDTGIGIDQGQLQRVFEPYVQDPAGARLNQEGLGIGLMLVRQLVQAHGGEVVAHSDGPDRGSRFVVTLPLTAGS